MYSKMHQLFTHSFNSSSIRTGFINSILHLYTFISLTHSFNSSTISIHLCVHSFCQPSIH